MRTVFLISIKVEMLALDDDTLFSTQRGTESEYISMAEQGAWYAMVRS